jgi:hypothetical protein
MLPPPVSPIPFSLLSVQALIEQRHQRAMVTAQQCASSDLTSLLLLYSFEPVHVFHTELKGLTPKSSAALLRV